MADGVAITPGTGATAVARAAGTPGTFVDVAGQVQTVELGVVASGVAYARPQTGTVTSVSASATSANILAASGTRRGHRIYNSSSSRMFVKYGTTASTSSYTVIVAPNGGYHEENDYGGRVDAVWEFAVGVALVTALS